MGIFALAQNTINLSAGVITGSIDISVDAALATLDAQLQAMGIWELLGLWLETWLISICLWVLTICIFVIIYGRMIEIYLVVSVAPIPLSTMVNRDVLLSQGWQTKPPLKTRTTGSFATV